MIYKMGIEAAGVENVRELAPEMRPEKRVSEDYLKATDLDLLLTATGMKNIGKADEVLRCLASGDLSGLRHIDGITEKLRSKAIAISELAKRLGIRKEKIEKPADIYTLIRHFAYSKQEHFIVCTLDGAYQIIEVHVVTIGLLNRSLIHPREVFVRAIEDRAAAIVIAHNHPSGNLNPSKDDLDITRRLTKAGELMDIKVLDHLIFNEHEFRSLAEKDEL